VTRPCDRRALLVTDIDGTLILPGADQPGLDRLRAILGARGDRFVFAVATGRSPDQARRVLAAHGVPAPDVLIASVGTEIEYSEAGREFRLDRGWPRSLARGWDPGVARAIGERVPGLTLQPPAHQGRFKVSFDLEPGRFCRAALDSALDTALDTARVAITAIVSRGAQLDLVPRAASKGRAVRHVRRALGIPRGWTVAAGDSGNDEDMLADAGFAVIVADHDGELDRLASRPRTLLSAAPGAEAILEGLERSGLPGLRPPTVRGQSAGQLRSGVGWPSATNRSETEFRQ
jgi:sucrose-phosphate synthase